MALDGVDGVESGNAGGRAGGRAGVPAAAAAAVAPARLAPLLLSPTPVHLRLLHPHLLTVWLLHEHHPGRRLMVPPLHLHHPAAAVVPVLLLGLLLLRARTAARRARLPPLDDAPLGPLVGSCAVLRRAAVLRRGALRGGVVVLLLRVRVHPRAASATTPALAAR